MNTSARLLLPTVPGPRLLKLRRTAGYAAATTMSLYLAVKIVWVAAALLGDQPGGDWGTTGWVLLNLVTVGMSAVGVVLGLALAQPWGQRVPAPLVVLFAWVGAGFLVPLLPYMVLSLVLGAFGVGDDGGGGDAGGSGGGTAVPGWETAFIVVGFLGMAVGLAVALPIYLWGRWPSAFAGRLGERTPTAASQRLARLLPVAWVALVVGTASGLLRLVWGLGGTLGLDPAHVDDMDLDGQLLNASWGGWALIGSWVLWLLLTPGACETAAAMAARGAGFRRVRIVVRVEQLAVAAQPAAARRLRADGVPRGRGGAARRGHRRRHRAAGPAAHVATDGTAADHARQGTGVIPPSTRRSMPLM